MADSSTNLDPLSVLHALGLSDIRSITRVIGGADTAIWRVERGAAAYALRVFRPEQEPTRDREVVAMETAGAAGIPVPSVHARGSWNGRPVLLLSWCAGRPILDQLRARPWQAIPYGRLFGRMQAAIHGVPAPRALVEGAHSWLDWLPPDDVGLRERLQRPDVRRDALLHLDYHPLNVMAEGGRITGVLDWTNTRAGDPRADFARTRTILRLDMGRPGRSRVANAALEPLWRAFEWGWWQGYRDAAPVIDDLAPFYAAAGAIMQRDLGDRYMPGQLAPVRKWTIRWKRRSGLTEPT